MFEFLGKLMGIAARSQQFMDITLAPLVWKLLVEEEVTREDYTEIDQHGASFVESIRREESEAVFEVQFGWMDFTGELCTESLLHIVAVAAAAGGVVVVVVGVVVVIVIVIVVAAAA